VNDAAFWAILLSKISTAVVYVMTEKFLHVIEGQLCALPRSRQYA